MAWNCDRKDIIHKEGKGREMLIIDILADFDLCGIGRSRSFDLIVSLLIT